MCAVFGPLVALFVLFHNVLSCLNIGSMPVNKKCGTRSAFGIKA